MKVILRKDHQQLGKMGDVKDVKDGYARNFLIPRSIAYQATPNNLKQLEEEKKQHAKRSEKERKGSESLAEQLGKSSVTIKMKVGEDDKLFGSVTSQMIADALAEKGVTLDKRQIELEDTIKSLGIYDVPVKLSGGISAQVKVWIVRE
ncbi:MAG: 50S ribosomal protein L9 [Ignavibacteriales bacterium]|nr:50S ribosomal protein L9 [Ignavibacteriales bacterium]